MRFVVTEARARSLAAIGLIGLVLAVTANGQPRSFGPVSLDTVIVGVPLAILLCLPYVRRRGLDSVPMYLMGPAALAFISWGLLSVAVDGGQFASLLTMVRYASYFLLAIAVSVVAQDAQIRRGMLWVVAVTAGLTTVLALAQYLDPHLTPGMNGISPEISTRVVGTFYNSNFYAEYLLLATGVSAALFFTERRLARALAALLGVMIVVAMLLTYTRGSWIGLAIGLVIFVTVVDVRYLAAVAVAGVAGILLVPGVTARLSQSTANSGSAEFRLGIWQIAGQAMRAKPLFGYGAGDFLQAYRAVVIAHPELYQGYLGFGAHNSYFELAAEIGIIGGLLFLVVTLGYATRGIFVATRHGADPAVKYTALALSSAMVGFIANTFTSNTFQHPQSGLFFWILAGVVAAVGAGSWQVETRPQACAEVADGSMAATSRVAPWALAVRGWVGSTWRASVCFARTALPKQPRGSWFESSAVLRAIFGADGADKHSEV